ncbi:MAG: hypothetical protein BGP16_03745 [Sphingobium sp. 66-54]|nr:MAG: hypothetical protein BGP16_03745 [Sphingobium sp. 66-54]
MTRAALVMAAVSAASALAGAVVLSRPAHSEQAIYGKRIVATMALAFALILALFAWGLERASG